MAGEGGFTVVGRGESFQPVSPRGSWCRDGEGSQSVSGRERARRQLHTARGGLKVENGRSGIVLPLKKKMEPFGLKGTGRFVWFTSQTIGSTNLIPVQPLFGSIDQTGRQLDRPVRFLKPWFSLSFRFYGFVIFHNFAQSLCS